MTARVRAPTLRKVSAKATPTLASLERARARQQATLRLLRPLGAGVVVLVIIGVSRTRPRPGLSDDRLGVLLALTGFAVGVIGVFGAGVFGAAGSRRAGSAAQAPFFTLLLLSSAALVWLQPDGPGLLAAFIAIATAAMRVRGWLAVALLALALVALGVAEALTSQRALSSIVLNELGVSAYFVLALLARRLREGQEQAERLLLELEASREAQARAAALAERQRLAGEMHDVLAHSLSALVLQLEGARLLAGRKQADADLAAAVERAHHLAKAGLVEARRAIGMLRDEALPGPERLEFLAREFERDAGVPCVMEVTGAPRELDSEARLTMYRVAQEALTNVRKHASPRRVALLLAYEPGGTRLTVEDSGGNGRAPLTGDRRGYGLTGMRERAELLGGSLAAAATESGFRVELWVPG
jgi:signal transduction histidine kinase